MKTFFYKNIILKIKSFFQKKERSLLDIANREKKNNKELKRIVKNKLPPLWMPSVSSFLRIFFVMMFFWIISHPKYLVELILSPLHSLFLHTPFLKTVVPYIIKMFSLLPHSIPIISEGGNLLAVHAGVGSVLIGLAFFVAQSLTDKSDSEKSRVLLYKSYFFPLLVAEVMAFFFFIGKTNVLVYIPIAGIAFWTLYSLGKVIDILVKEYKMEEAKKRVLLNVTKENFIRILDRETTYRIGNNFIYKKYESSGILDVNPFGFSRDKKTVVRIKSQKSGAIVDIKMNELERLILLLSQAVKVDFPIGNAETTNDNGVKVKSESLCCLLTLLGHKIELEQPLFEIKKEIADKIGVKRLEKIIERVFLIKDDISEVEARTEVLKLKDRCILAINNQQTGELEKIIKLYVELVNEFSKYFNLYHGGCFSSEQARQERNSFFERLKPLDWISKDIREIFDRGINSEDLNIIRDVAYLPIMLVQQAIESKDHLIFQEFIPYSLVLYEKAFDFSKKDREKESEIMFDRTWRYLKELSAYYLESKLKEEDYPEGDFKDYYIQILKILQALLKSSFDKKDLTNFNKFLKVTSDLFNRLDRPYSNSSYTNTEKVFNLLDGKRQEMFFGVSSWILFILKNNKDLQVREFYNAVQNELPSDIIEFTRVFLQSHSFDTEDHWGWDWWESRPDEGVHTINVLEKLEQFFVVRLLILLGSKSDQEIEKISLPHNRDLAFLAEGTRDAIKIIDDIEKNPGNWTFILDSESVKRCLALRNLLKKAHDQQEQDDLRCKREADISRDKVEKFKKYFIENYKQSHPIKEMLKDFGLLSNKTNKKVGKEIKKLGINTLFDKGAFLGDEVNWYIHYTGIKEAFGFGRSMVYGENEYVLGKIRGKAKEITEDRFENTLAGIQLSNIVLIATNHAVWKFFERSNSNWIPKWHSEFPKELFGNQIIEGVYRFKDKIIPVYQLFTSGSSSSDIFILDKTKIGKLVQFSPLEDGDSTDVLFDVFLIDVQEFILNSTLITEFIDKPPQWLSDIGNKEKQIEHLQECVLIHVFEKIQFKLHNEFSGYILLTDKIK